MGLQQLQCVNCGARIHGRDVNMDNAIARCTACGAIFAITSESFSSPETAPAQPQGAPVSDPPAGRQIAIPMPKRFRVDNFGGTLTIQYRWWTPLILFLIFFAVIWNGFMIGWHSIALRDGMWIMSAFGLIHTAVGVGLIYVCLACILNTTTIRADSGQLTIRHHPLPWPGGRTNLDTHNIKQLYVKRHVSHSKNGTRTTYQLHAITQEGRRKKLLTGLNDEDQALYLEQEIETHLGIENTPVQGELGHW